MKTASMGITYAEIELIREADLILVEEGFLQADQVRKLKVLALVDTDASMLAITRSACEILALRQRGQTQAELAAGSVVMLDVVGPIEVRFQNRRTSVEAIVIPDEGDVLLGAIPLEGLDVLVDPKNQQLIVNPESPDVAHMLLK